MLVSVTLPTLNLLGWPGTAGNRIHSNKTLAYSSTNTWLCTIHKDYLLYV